MTEHVEIKATQFTKLHKRPLRKRVSKPEFNRLLLAKFNMIWTIVHTYLKIDPEMRFEFW